MTPEASGENLEERRLALQKALDEGKPRAARNASGQFATPTALALDILEYAKALCPAQRRIRFLDPAIGTGAFFSALRAVFPPSQVAAAAGYEIDRHYAVPAAAFWKGTELVLRQEDFTRAVAPSGAGAYDLVICNPPYVRHHHIASSDKPRLKNQVRLVAGMEASGLAGLYCYFLGLSHAWMAPGALAGWLIPSEFMDVNYGASIKQYLLDKVTLLHIHRFDPHDVQFGDALVSSVVVWLRNRRPPADHHVRLSFGGSLLRPRQERRMPAAAMRGNRKWTNFNGSGQPDESPTLGDFFTIKRGVATGGNGFFILTEEEIRRRRLPREVFRPILPGPRHVAEGKILAGPQGIPKLSRRLFLLDCRLAPDEVRRRHPQLWAYLEEGREQGVSERYICRHRTPWYAQERRPAAPFVCTYMGRTRREGSLPFRFILNYSQATAANVYLMLYPQRHVTMRLERVAGLREEVWDVLRTISPQAMLGEGRVYGGGLHKLEPQELGNVPTAKLAQLFPAATPAGAQEDLFDRPIAAVAGG